MSGLAAVLAGRHEPGVYRWHAAFDAADVGHAVEYTGWRFAHLDTWGSDTKADFLDGVGSALGFPGYYGRNFDALVDCLRDVTPEDQGTVLLWDGWGPFAHADRRSFDIALSVLADRADDGARGPFLVLLRGDGPDLDLDSLD